MTSNNNITHLGASVSYGKLWPATRDVPRRHPRRWPRLDYADLVLSALQHGYRDLHELLRLNWPYGRWRLIDGREVLFNRNYQPLLARQAGGNWQWADPRRWVRDIVATEYFYYDGNPPWRSQDDFERLQAVLQEVVVAGNKRGQL